MQPLPPRYPQRGQFYNYRQNPEIVVRVLGVAEGSIVVDIGGNPFHFSLPLLRTMCVERIPTLADALTAFADDDGMRFRIQTYAHLSVIVARGEARDLWGPDAVPFDPPAPEPPDMEEATWAKQTV